MRTFIIATILLLTACGNGNIVSSENEPARKLTISGRTAGSGNPADVVIRPQEPNVPEPVVEEPVEVVEEPVQEVVEESVPDVPEPPETVQESTPEPEVVESPSESPEPVKNDLVEPEPVVEEEEEIVPEPEPEPEPEPVVEPDVVPTITEWTMEIRMAGWPEGKGHIIGHHADASDAVEQVVPSQFQPHHDLAAPPMPPSGNEYFVLVNGISLLRDMRSIKDHDIFDVRIQNVGGSATLVWNTPEGLTGEVVDAYFGNNLADLKDGSVTTNFDKIKFVVYKK